MAHPSALSAFGSGVCDSVGCSSGREGLILHHVRHNGKFRRLCSSCVLLFHPAAFCSVCFFFLSPGAAAAACSRCGDFAAHLSCVRGPFSFVCPRCAAAARHRAFSYDLARGARRVFDERAARVLLVAAQIAHESMTRAAAEAHEEAERRVEEATAARKRSREALDAAFRAMEAEANEAQQPKMEPSSEAERDTGGRLPKLNAIKQPRRRRSPRPPAQCHRPGRARRAQ